jgi:hypothetical protein
MSGASGSIATTEHVDAPLKGHKLPRERVYRDD